MKLSTVNDIDEDLLRDIAAAYLRLAAFRIQNGTDTSVEVTEVNGKRSRRRCSCWFSISDIRPPSL